MLRPSKHSHPDQTVVNVAVLLLGKLKMERVAEYDGLRKYLRRRVRGSEFLFLPALNFLYLLGLVEYRPKTDTIEYLGPNEII
jgi:hypothetical protein